LREHAPHFFGADAAQPYPEIFWPNVIEVNGLNRRWRGVVTTFFGFVSVFVAASGAIFVGVDIFETFALGSSDMKSARAWYLNLRSCHSRLLTEMLWRKMRVRQDYIDLGDEAGRTIIAISRLPWRRCRRPRSTRSETAPCLSKSE